MRRIPLLLLALLVSLPAFAADDGGAGDLAKTFFAALFERRYEDAHALTTGRTPEDAAFARYDAWAGKYFSPNDLKVLRVKPDGEGALAVVTFKYKTPAGVDAVERAELRLAGKPGGYKVEGLKRREAPAEPRPAQAFQPVTIPENGPAAGGNPLGAAAGLLGGLSGGSGKLDQLMNSGPIAQLMGDPQIMALASDPRIQAIAADPRIVGAILSGDLDTVMKDPRLMQLADDPAFKGVLEKYAPSGDSGGEDGASPDFGEIMKMLGN